MKLSPNTKIRVVIAGVVVTTKVKDVCDNRVRKLVEFVDSAGPSCAGVAWHVENVGTIQVSKV